MRLLWVPLLPSLGYVAYPNDGTLLGKLPGQSNGKMKWKLHSYLGKEHVVKLQSSSSVPKQRMGEMHSLLKASLY